MKMLLEQHSSAEASGGSPDSHRLLVRDLLMWGQSEVSAARRVAAWLALAWTLVIAVLLLLGP
jgi:hypothetical protein